MEKKLTHKKRNLGKILILIIIVSLSLAYFFIPTFNSKVNGIFMLFSSMSIESVAGYIRSFGIYAVLVSFLLMVFQSVAAPLPAFLITFANAAIFGWWKGALLSWISSMTGAALCFYIGRILGRDAVEKLTSKYAMASVDGFFEKYGKHTILVCRLLPFVSFDFISYAAGLTSMGFLEFIVATGIGQLPATVVYSYIGGMLTGGAQMIVTALLILFAITVLVFMFKQIYNERQKKSKK
ncbi:MULTISPECIES: TVP38/TMEM64 family protein [unclassified Clostridium]|uniref:TVP38/TMEM64 family protein n=1 Tax=unclassified Clostridium TaxID=2614128 RepID=UPI000E94F877|nr:TVP38/TMEM64 family protein [Clostridium sp.]